MEGEKNRSLIVRPKRGEKDAIGETVTQVLIDHGTYVIYLTKEMGVRWTIYDASLSERLTPLHDHMAEIRALQTGKLAENDALNRQIGLALRQAFQGEADSAVSILSKVKTRLVKSRRATGQVRYLSFRVGDGRNGWRHGRINLLAQLAERDAGHLVAGGLPRKPRRVPLRDDWTPDGGVGY